MSDWKAELLGEVADSIDYGVTASAVQHPVGPKFLRITDIQEGTVDWGRVPWCEYNARASSDARLRPGDIVFARTGATTGKSFLIRDCPENTVFASYLIRVRLGNRAEPRFISHYFRTPTYWAQIARRARGVAQPGVNATTLKQLKVPIPPLREQQRIAEVLDRADALRAKRRTTLARLDALTDAVFLELFGDPVAIPGKWPMTQLKDVLSCDLRNGLSPSHSGAVPAKVLTLSAITGDAFDATAWKTSTFQTAPPPDLAVNEDDFLICRGNGNVRLVGKGYFPTGQMTDVIFPDTMIAARISTSLIERTFLQHIWNSNVVRRQIESLARTTSGIFKVNQTMLKRIAFVLPPLSLQSEFARRVSVIDGLRTVQRASLRELDALFASIQHRAFRGEL